MAKRLDSKSSPVGSNPTTPALSTEIKGGNFMLGKVFSKEMIEEIKDLVKENGSPVLMNSPYCVKRRPKWRGKHSKCPGCESELGCNKVVVMMGAVMKHAFICVSDCKDYQEKSRRIEGIKDRILDAQTMGELDKIKGELQKT